MTARQRFCPSSSEALAAVATMLRRITQVFIIMFTASSQEVRAVQSERKLQQAFSTRCSLRLRSSWLYLLVACVLACTV